MRSAEGQESSEGDTQGINYRIEIIDTYSGRRDGEERR